MLRQIAVGVVLMLLSSGCTTNQRMYDGPSLPKIEISVLELKYEGIKSPSQNSNFSVARIDDKDEPISAGVSKLEFLPGHHSLTLSTRVWTHLLIGVPFVNPTIPIYYSTELRTIEFEAKASLIYQLRALYYLDHFWAWIAEKKDGRIIAGRPPPIPRFLKVFAARGDAGAQYDLGSIYLHERHVSEGWKLICSAANQAHPGAQLLAGYFYEGRTRIIWPSPEPSPVKVNPVIAHMWYSLAASKGIKEAVSYKNGLTDRMTLTQRANAEKLAKEWKPMPGDCRVR